MSGQKLTGYELSRNWFDWTFENPDIVNTNHTALYFYILELNNRLGSKEKFGLPSAETKDCLGIKSHNTYIKTLNDLIEWGFIKLIQKSQNQFTATIIAISKNNKATTKALDKAIIRHQSEQRESTVQSIDNIDKPVTSNKETSNTLSVFDSFRVNFPGTKKGCEVEFQNLQKKHKDWKEILPLLQPALDYQIATRAKLKAIPGKFVPEWKNLQTWINQRCWEEEIEGYPKTPAQTATATSEPIDMKGFFTT